MTTRSARPPKPARAPAPPPALPSARDGWSALEIEAPRDEVIIDLTPQLRPALRSALRRDGLLSLAVESPLVSLLALDTEPGAVADMLAMLERLAPRNEYYQINLRTPMERTGAARVRAALLPRTLVLPYRDRKPLLPDGIVVHAIRHEPARTRKFILHIGLT